MCTFYMHYTYFPYFDKHHCTEKGFYSEHSLVGPSSRVKVQAIFTFLQNGPYSRAFETCDEDEDIEL